MCAPRVVIIDDQPSFRRAARELLDLRGYTVVGEADCGAAALQLATCLAPDGVLLDVRLGEESGFDVARELTRVRPAIAVLLVSADEELEGLPCIGACGARGFVAKRRLVEADLGALWDARHCACAVAG